MRKLLGVTLAAAALSAFGMGGTASAACSTADGPTGYDSTGAVVVPGEVFVLGSNNDVGGRLTGVGYGQTDVNAGTGGADYDGTLSNDSALVGYGDLQGSATTGGVSGSADGETANGAVSGAGSLSGTTLTVTATVAGVCLP